jgi:hypothetical protein
MNSMYTVRADGPFNWETELHTDLGRYAFRDEFMINHPVQGYYLNETGFLTDRERHEDIQLAVEIQHSYLSHLQAEVRWCNNRLSEVYDLLSDEEIASWERSLED